MQFNFVVSTNEPAVKLWERLGFTIVGTLPGAFRHRTRGFVDVYVMFRTLVERDKVGPANEPASGRRPGIHGHRGVHANAGAATSTGRDDSDQANHAGVPTREHNPPRWGFRISTLMLLTIIAALSLALVVERWQKHLEEHRMIASLERANAQARQSEAGVQRTRAISTPSPGAMAPPANPQGRTTIDGGP
jgi:hypothetical protein